MIALLFDRMGGIGIYLTMVNSPAPGNFEVIKTVSCSKRK